MRVLLFILFFPFSFSGHDDGKELLNMALDRCEHLESLEDYRDILSRYGMTDKLPLACPLKEKFRISSTYGGRIHPLTKNVVSIRVLTWLWNWPHPSMPPLRVRLLSRGEKADMEDVSLYGILTALKRCMLIWLRIIPQKGKTRERGCNRLCREYGKKYRLSPTL